MPASPQGRPGRYAPYFAPSTIVVGAVVVALSIIAGRYTGALVMNREATRYGPPPVSGTAAQPHAGALRGTARPHAAHPVPT
jgi:hypothetical protein